MTNPSPPPGRKRTTFALMVGNYANTAIVVAQGLLLVPLYLIYLGAYRYGVWLAAFGVLNILAVINFGINSVLNQRLSVAYGENALQKVVTYLAGGIAINAAASILFLVIGFALSFWLPSMLKIAGADVDATLLAVRIAALGIALSFFNELLRVFTSSLLRPVASMWGMAVGRIAGLLVTVALLIGGQGLPSIAVGILVGEVIGLVANLVSAGGLYRSLQARMKLDYATTLDLVRVSPAVFLARLSMTASQEIEPLLVTLFIAPEVTAAYMVTRRVADMLNQMLSIIAGSILGTFAHLVSQGDRERIVRVAGDLLMFVLTLSIVGYAVYVSANQSFVRLWVGDNMDAGQLTIVAIGVAYLIKTFKGMPYQLLYGLGSFRFVSLVTVVEGVIRLSLSLLLLWRLGVVGLPLALAISNLVSAWALLDKLRAKLDVRLAIFPILQLAMLGGMAFAIGPGLATLGITIDSWASLGVYVLTAAVLVGAVSAVMNGRRLVDMYRRRVTRYVTK